MTDLEVLAQLGRELLARGPDWEKYLPPLRVLYRHVRDGVVPRRGDWSLEHALEIVAMAGIHDAWPAFDSHARCPRCALPRAGMMSFSHVHDVESCGQLPDRAGYECRVCGLRWVAMFERSAVHAATSVASELANSSSLLTT